MFGLFSKDKGLQKAIERSQNRYAQSADRWAAMEKLRNLGSEESLFGLCKRFSFNCDKSIEDQQEKQWVVETLVSLGDSALPPLRRYLLAADAVGYPLRVLEKIVDTPKIIEVIDELLAKEEPGYTREPRKRMDVIEWLTEWDGMENAEIAARVIPYLEDFDENVRMKAVEALDFKPCQEASEPLVRALVNAEEESKRLKLRIAEVLSKHELDLAGKKSEVSALFDDLLSDYKLQRDKLVRRKK